MRYLVILERGETSWGAHVPDLPGCVAVADTREEAIDLIRDAIDFHLDGLKRAGSAIPKPCSDSMFVEISAA
jgi:predicted RNase H-like HicB family nuclease